MTKTFKPIFTITNRITSGLTLIEQARGFLEAATLSEDWVREMGWGAGMGLPNMKKNADEFSIDSVVGEGTTIKMKMRFP